MNSNRIQATAPVSASRHAQLQRMEADLARIVGERGSEALLARSRELCGSAEPSRTAQMRTLLQLVRKLLGKSLEQWLLQSATGGVRVQGERQRLR